MKAFMEQHRYALLGKSASWKQVAGSDTHMLRLLPWFRNWKRFQEYGTLLVSIVDHTLQIVSLDWKPRASQFHTCEFLFIPLIYCRENPWYLRWVWVHPSISFVNVNICFDRNGVAMSERHLRNTSLEESSYICSKTDVCLHRPSDVSVHCVFGKGIWNQ